MSIEFKDRVSTYPNRYKVTPAGGSTYYATLERADVPTELGTPLNAETLNELVEHIDGKVGIVKLWKNASPTSSFAAQTINLDLSKYDAVLIGMCSGTNAGIVGTYSFEVGGGTQMTYGAGAYMGRRNLKVTTSGITFETGSKYESSWEDSNAYQKPMVIYGVTGVLE